MSDYDAVIIGGGPAGLTAGLYLSRANWKTLLLEKENFGGYIMNIDMIENYPGFPEGVSGAVLGSQMADQAAKFGLKMEMAEVTGLEIFSSSKWVSCSGGNGFTADAIIISGGSHLKKLGVPGEEKLRGKGVISCALCDGGEFANKVIAVCGGGDAGVTEALYLSKIASKVHLVEFMPKLTATSILQDRVASNPKIKVHCGIKVEAVLGEDHVSGLEIRESGNDKTEVLPVEGLLVHIGLDPNTGYLDGIVPLDGQRKIAVGNKMETELSGVFSAGDIRSGSPGQVCTAVGDGGTAAISAIRYLQTLNK
jgi:thioredoxin reductase (NADPH)